MQIVWAVGLGMKVMSTARNVFIKHLREAAGGGWEGVADEEMSMISFGTAIAVGIDVLYM